MTYYYPIIFFNHNELCMGGPYDDYDKMMEDLKKAVAQNPNKVKATTYITRSKEMSLMDIMGHPKSRDLMSDKKFLKEIEYES